MRPGAQFGGAQCALHVGIGANFVCARCGNFMCATCAVNGTEQQCPTCRNLNPIGFPYDANADLGTLWGHATARYQNELVMCVVAGLIYFAMLMGAGIVSNIINAIISAVLGSETAMADPLKNLGRLGLDLALNQVVASVVSLVVQGVALVGFYRVLMDVLVGKKADLARMFSQVHLLANFVVMHLIMYVVITIPTFVFMAIVAWVGMRMIGLDLSSFTSFDDLSALRPERLLDPALLGLFAGSSVVLIVVSVVLLPVTLFATPELIVGQCGPVEALKRAWDLGEGQRLRIFGYSFVASVVLLVGMLLCLVGLVFTGPLAALLVLSLFLALRRSSSLPPALHT